MLNTTLTTGVLLVQFSDWQTNVDSRGSVGYVDNNGDHKPDVVQYNKYRYINYWNLIFSENQYTGTAHPDYNDYYNYSPLWNAGNLTVYGSLHEYWKEVSYGNLNVAPGATRPGESGIVNESEGNGVITWITLDHTKGYYLSTYGQSASAVTAIASDAISKAQQLYQIGQLDVNVNNFQRLIILFAGMHVYGVSTIGYFGSNSMWVIDAEKYGDDTSPITGTFRYLSVIAHEFGHTIGFGDYHGVYQGNYGVGHYSIMGRNDPSFRNSPPHLDPFNKLMKGWVGSLMVNNPNYNPLSNQYLPPVEEKYNGGLPYVAVIPISGTPGQNGNWQQGEYFIVENRKVENFDRFLNNGDGGFKGGFIVWHYSSTTSLHNSSPLEVTEADGRYDLAKQFGSGDYGTPTDFWPGTISNDVLSPWSTPNSKFGNGTMTNAGMEVRFYDVNTGSYNVDLFYAGVVNASPSKPQNFRITNTTATPINLAWNANLEPDFSSYEIQRNDLSYQTGWVSIGTTTSTTLTDYEYIWSGTWGNDRLQYKVRAKDTQNKYSVFSDIASINAEGNSNTRRSVNPAADAVITAEVPEENSLCQNYPNPFNPTTQIRFTLLKPLHVRLIVYDMLGREVARLADEQMSEGYHTVTWNASGLASGVYIYRLSAGNFIQANRMILMK